MLLKENQTFIELHASVCGPKAGDSPREPLRANTLSLGKQIVFVCVCVSERERESGVMWWKCLAIQFLNVTVNHLGCRRMPCVIQQSQS